MNTATPVVIVTGGACGIGRGLARYFSARGFRTVIADIDQEGGRQLERELAAAGQSALFVVTDVRDDTAIAAMVAQAAAIGPLTVLVNNVGVEAAAPSDQFAQHNWERMMSINLRSVAACSAAAYPHLLKTRGSVVNISSIQGLATEPGYSVYAATKAGILGLTRGLAVDFAPKGVRVNAVCPGAVYTAMTDAWLATKDNPDHVMAHMVAGIPLGRLAQPEEIAALVHFLASAEASYITGATFVVDGGVMARHGL